MKFKIKNWDYNIAPTACFAELLLRNQDLLLVSLLRTYQSEFRPAKLRDLIGAPTLVIFYKVFADIPCTNSYQTVHRQYPALLNCINSSLFHIVLFRSLSSS